MNGNNHSALVDALTACSTYQEYARSFSELTGMPVSLRPVDTWQLPLHGKKNENQFCNLMADRSRSCAACLQVQQRLSLAASREAHTITCPNGLSDTAVPIRLGEQVVGFLQTGQVFRRKPTPALFDRVVGQVAEWGLPVDEDELRRVYYASRVLHPRQHESVVRMLSIFADHLAIITNQIVVHQEHSEPPVIIRAKEFITQHQAEDLSLGQVARAVNTSTFYFCKMFKKATGLNFTEYLSRIRIEKAKNLALNPNLRISEIAFEVGFQSLTHFNRVFKKIVGQSPTQYRSQLALV